VTTFDLGDTWASVAREAYRLETRQTYAVASEKARIRAWRIGVPWPTEETPWQTRLTELVARGVRMRRVHVVDLPLTEYLRWEIESYRRNAAFGEDIRILSRDRVPAGLPDYNDYWMFDEQTVVLMHYDEAGHLSERELRTGDVEPYVTARDIAWEYAEPLAAWCRHMDRG